MRVASSTRLSSQLTRQQLIRSLLATVSVAGPTILSSSPCSAIADPIKFQADDKSFDFALPPGWVGMTPGPQERSIPSHLIAVSAQQVEGSATARAIVDGGSRGRAYGTSLAALGPLDKIATRLVQDELLNDDTAGDALVLSAEQVAGSIKGSSYYVIRYLVGAKPAIAKLAVIQNRLYCIKVKANKKASASFFDEPSTLQVDMESIVASYNAFPVNFICLGQSNKGNIPTAGSCY